jgi:hypothetical protein
MLDISSNRTVALAASPYKIPTLVRDPCRVATAFHDWWRRARLRYAADDGDHDVPRTAMTCPLDRRDGRFVVHSTRSSAS